MAKKKVKKVELDEESTEFTTRAAEKDMFLDIAPYLIIIFFIVVIRIFIATPVSVNGTSMFPTLEDGDTMLLYKWKAIPAHRPYYEIPLPYHDSFLIGDSMILL